MGYCINGSFAYIYELKALFIYIERIAGPPTWLVFEDVPLIFAKYVSLFTICHMQVDFPHPNPSFESFRSEEYQQVYDDNPLKL